MESSRRKEGFRVLKGESVVRRGGRLSRVDAEASLGKLDAVLRSWAVDHGREGGELKRRASVGKLRVSRDEWKERVWHLMARYNVSEMGAVDFVSSRYIVDGRYRGSVMDRQRRKPRITPGRAGERVRWLMRGLGIGRGLRQRRGGGLRYSEAVGVVKLNFSVLGSPEDRRAWPDCEESKAYEGVPW